MQDLFAVSLAKWVATHVAFPNAMVDRITPATTTADIDQVATFGISDQWPVTCEPFHQWVFEDSFSKGRPRWEECGAQIVNDVTPYETMKIRLLNAGHTVTGMLGSLHGYKTIDESVSDTVFAGLLRKFMDEEATPILGPVPGIDIEAYKATLIERFTNPNIKDNLSRICSESSSKVATFLVPTVQQNLRSMGQLSCSALVIAAWCHYSRYRKSQQGEALTIFDDKALQLHQAASASEADPLAFIKQQEIFADLVESPDFSRIYVYFMQQLSVGTPVKTLMSELLEDASVCGQRTSLGAPL